MIIRDDYPEAQELIRVISSYRALLLEQVLRLFPGKETAIRNLLQRLIKQQRLFFLKDSSAIAALPTVEINPQIVASFWVLLDFIARVSYHTASDFPVTISFFTECDAYDIICVTTEHENLINHTFCYINNDEAQQAHRIVVVDAPEQIPLLKIPNTAGYCTVKSNGVVTYYTLNEDSVNEQ